MSPTTIVRARRAGVIYFTQSANNDILFLLGVDRKTRDLCDFGGGAKRRETLHEAAAREANEETCGIFGTTINNIAESVVVTNVENTSVIYFVKLDSWWITYAKSLFIYKQRNVARHIKHHYELASLRWVDSAQFRDILYNAHNKQMWIKIKTHIRKNIKWHDLLHALYGNDNVAATARRSTYYGATKYTLHVGCSNNVCPWFPRVVCGPAATV
jgi:hypothetical protein